MKILFRIILFIFLIFTIQKYYIPSCSEYGFYIDDFDMGKTTLENILFNLDKKGIRYNLLQRYKNYFVQDKDKVIKAPYTYQLSFYHFFNKDKAHFTLYFSPKNKYLWRVEIDVSGELNNLLEKIRLKYGKESYCKDYCYVWEEKIGILEVWDKVSVCKRELETYNVRIVINNPYWYIEEFDKLE